MNPELNVLKILAIVFLLAFLTESLVEYLVGTPLEKVKWLQKFKWLTMYVAAVVGVVGAFVYGFDLIYLLGQFVGAPMPSTTFGIILTGCGIGRGANYLHDLVKRWFIKPTVDASA